jgi:hypothetical protein
MLSIQLQDCARSDDECMVFVHRHCRTRSPKQAAAYLSQLVGSTGGPSKSPVDGPVTARDDLQICLDTTRTKKPPMSVFWMCLKTE